MRESSRLRSPVRSSAPEQWTLCGEGVCFAAMSTGRWPASHSLILLLFCACGDDTTPPTQDSGTTSEESSTEADSESSSADASSSSEGGDGDATTGGDGDGDGDSGDGDAEATGDGDGEGQWHLPECEAPSGIPGLAFSPDGGATVHHTDTPFSGTSYTFGIARLAQPNHLVAQSGDKLYRSEDAGCTWTVIDGWSGSFSRLTVGPQDRVWIWGDNLTQLAYLDGTTVTYANPELNVRGIATDPDDPDRVYMGDDMGVRVSDDAGQTWTKMGYAPGEQTLAYRVAFAPTRPQRIIIGRMLEGMWRSDDFAESWNSATGLNPLDPTEEVNAFDAAFTRYDEDIVWGLALEFSGLDSHRRMYRSEDGGQSFTAVQEDADPPGLIVSNGAMLWPHPDDTDRLFWSVGTCFSGAGADLYVYDHSLGQTTTYKHPYAGITTVEANPADPNFLYLGLQDPGHPGPECE